MKFHAVIGILLLALNVRAAAAETTRNIASDMAIAASRFLASLDDQQRAKATISYDDPRRLDWHNIPKAQRKGIPLAELSDEQRELCHELLKVALSESGYLKATQILALESNLREGEKNLAQAPIRDPLKYYLTVFGDPGTASAWGWSFEGHHFSLNFAVSDGDIIGSTPSFWGANPATVHTFVAGGPPAGTRVLADEELLAFELLASLDSAQRSIAIIDSQAPADYRAAGRPEPPHSAPAGLEASRMNNRQKEVLRKLLAAYSSHLAPELAKARIKEIEERGFERIHFAWLGSEKPGVGHAFRVQGPTFLLELVNVQSDPAGNPANHIHSVWRSLPHDFGVAGNR